MRLPPLFWIVFATVKQASVTRVVLKLESYSYLTI